MSDYFHNLVVRSFQPMLAARLLNTNLVAPAPESPRNIASRAQQEFEDPFAQPAILDNEAADEPDRSATAGTPAHLKDARRPRPIIPNRPQSDARVSENVRQSDEPVPSIETSPNLKSAAPRAQVLRELPGEATAEVENEPIANVRIPAGKPPQPSLDRAIESSKPIDSSEKDDSRFNFRPSPANKPADVDSALPLRSVSAEAAQRTRTTRASEDRSPHSVGRNLPSNTAPRSTVSAVQRVEVQRMIETVEKDQPAVGPLTALVPRPVAELLIPSSSKTQSNVIQNEAKPGEMAAGPPEAVVNVSIGRIEIRATPPTSRPERQRNPPHVMNLDEYVRQRSGGSR